MTFQKIGIIVAFLILNGCGCDKPDMYFIPKGYVGYIYIIYNVKGGQKLDYVDNKIINKIPENGIMLTVNECRGIEKNLLCDEFYYSETNGKLTNLPSQQIGDVVEKDQNLFACHMGVRSFSQGLTMDVLRIGPTNNTFWKSKKKMELNDLIDSLKLIKNVP